MRRKIVSLDQILKWPKTCAIRLYKKTRVVLFCENTKYFEKRDAFENQPSCKVYRLCKMVSLGKKKRWPKACEKRFYKHISAVLCKKTSGKNTKYSRNETIFENWPSCKGYRLCKMVSLGQKLQWPKTCKKLFYKDMRVVLCRKPLKKNKNKKQTKKNKYSRNETTLNIGHLTKL